MARLRRDQLVSGGGIGSASGTTQRVAGHPAVRHAVGAQAVEFGQAQLQRVEAEGVGHRVVEPVLLPGQQVAARRGPQPGPNSIIDSSRVMMNLSPCPPSPTTTSGCCTTARSAVVVDPGDAAPVHAALDALRPRAGGDSSDAPPRRPCRRRRRAAAASAGPGLRPGARADPVALRTRLPTATRIEVLGLRFDVLDVPGHTAGHIAYVQPRRRRRAAAAVLRRHAVLRPAAAACSKARRRRCSARWRGWRRCRTTRRSAARTSTRCRTCASPPRSSPATPSHRRLHAGRCQALRAAGTPTLPSTHRPGAPASTPSCAATEPDVVAAAARAGRRRRRSRSAVFAALREWKNRFR